MSHTHAEEPNKYMKKDWKKTHPSVKSGCLWMVRLKNELVKITHPGIVRKKLLWWQMSGLGYWAISRNHWLFVIHLYFLET